MLIPIFTPSCSPFEEDMKSVYIWTPRSIATADALLCQIWDLIYLTNAGSKSDAVTWQDGIVLWIMLDNCPHPAPISNNFPGWIINDVSDDDKLIGVHTCEEKEDYVFLSTKKGKCLRFPISNVRKFSGRNSVDVRGIRLSKEDTVISMYIIKHAKFTIDERNDYLKIANAIRRK